MSLLENLRSHRAGALKSGQKELAKFLGFVHSKVAEIGKNAGNRDTTDGEGAVRIKQLIVQTEEAIQAAGDKLAAEARAAMEAEIATLKTYLPEQLTEESLRGAIRELIGDAERTPRLMGTVMQGLKDKFAGRYDNKRASDIVREELVKS